MITLEKRICDRSVLEDIPPKLLIITDDERDRNTIFKVVEENFDVDVYHSIFKNKNLELIKNDKFNLVFLDVSDRQKAGFDLLKNIKAKDEAQPVLIICKKDPSLELANRFIPPYAIDYIYKPIKDYDLFFRLNMYFHFFCSGKPQK